MPPGPAGVAGTLFRKSEARLRPKAIERETSPGAKPLTGYETPCPTRAGRRPSLFLAAFVAGASVLASSVNAQVEVWLTDPNGSARFGRQDPDLTSGTAVGRGPTIEVRP
jgi:hypothetical protein